MRTSGNDPRIDQAIAILHNGAQRQDSAAEQLQDVVALATAAGCYDALDLLSEAFHRDPTGTFLPARDSQKVEIIEVISTNLGPMITGVIG